MTGEGPRSFRALPGRNDVNGVAVGRVRGERHARIEHGPLRYTGSRNPVSSSARSAAPAVTSSAVTSSPGTANDGITRRGSQSRTPGWSRRPGVPEPGPDALGHRFVPQLRQPGHQALSHEHAHDGPPFPSA
jgi:hypothetical protein